MTRQEIYKIIKEKSLEEPIKIRFNGKNYTNIPTIELEKFIEIHMHKEQKKMSGMTESESNDICNQKIIDKLAQFFNEVKGITFKKGLYQLYLSDLKTDESSQQTLWKLNQCMNASKRMKSLIR